MRLLCTKQVNDQKEPSIWILISFHQLHVDCVKRVFPCKKSQSPNKYTWHERTYQPDDVALGDCVCNWMNDFLRLVNDNDREEEDVDDSSSRADNSDGDESRSNGDVFVFVNTFIWCNDSSALSTLSPLPNNRSADSLIKQNSGAASSRTANRNTKYNNCLRSFCICSCCRCWWWWCLVVGVVWDVRLGRCLVGNGDEMNWRPSKGDFSVCGGAHMIWNHSRLWRLCFVYRAQLFLYNKREELIGRMDARRGWNHALGVLSPMY